MNPLNLPEPPSVKLEYANFRTPWGIMRLPTDPVHIVWHVDTAVDKDQLVHTVSGDPALFDRSQSAQAFSDLQEAINYCQESARPPAPGLRTLVQTATCENFVFRTTEPTISLADANSLSAAKAAELRQYLLDTGPLPCETPWLRTDLVQKYPDLFFTKSAAKNLIAARPLHRKTKKPNPLTPTEAPAPAPKPARTPKTPIEIHAELRHLPAVNFHERRERRQWLLVRGCIPIPYHRAFLTTFLPVLRPSRLNSADWQAAPSTSTKVLPENYGNTSSCIGPLALTRNVPGWREFDTCILRCNQSEPDYHEELEFFHSVNNSITESLDKLFAPDLVFDSCPTYRPGLHLPDIPNPVLHFLRRYRRTQVARALSYYHQFLPHLIAASNKFPVDETRNIRWLERHEIGLKEFLLALLRLQRAMGLRTYPNQSSCATHLSTEELDRL